MARTATFSLEEGLGLGAAVVLHVALALALWLQPDRREDIAPPERIVVNIAEEVALESAAPDPSEEAAAAFAPELAPVPAPPEPEAAEEPRPVPTARATQPPPTPRPTARPTQRPSPRATATARPTARPTATPSARPSARASATPRATPTPQASATRAGGSRIGADFLEGQGATDGNRGTPAATFGAAERAALNGAVTRQLRPHWSAPPGVDVEQLVTVISWELNQDGTLRGTPRVVSQTGITDSNRTQAAVHAERAIRAVQLAAPFNLPDQFYDRWRRLQWTFDRRL